MNTLEKRKLEAIISGKLLTARNEYRRRREEELNALVVKCRTNVPDKVQKIVAKFEVARADFNKKNADIEKRIKEIKEEQSALFHSERETLDTYRVEAKKLGYEIHAFQNDKATTDLYSVRDYSNPVTQTSYIEPTLEAHIKETQKGYRAIDDLSTTYTLAVWADGEDMGKTLKQFQQDLKAIIA
jgi:hypothetical protein